MQTKITKYHFILLFFCAIDALACRPSAQHRYPTLEENIENAASIYLGKVSSIKSNGSKTGVVGEEFEIELKVESTLKGKSTKHLKVITVSSSCDTLATKISAGSTCVFLLTKDNSLVSGVLAGPASDCASGGRQDENAFRKEWKSRKFQGMK